MFHCNCLNSLEDYLLLLFTLGLALAKALMFFEGLTGFVFANRRGGFEYAI